MSGEEGWIAIPCTVKLAREKSPTLTSDIRGTKPVRASKVATKSTVQTIPYPEALDPNANRRSAGKVLGGAEPRLVAAAVAARQWWKRRRGAGAAEQQSSRAAEQQGSRAAGQQSSRQGSRAAGAAAPGAEERRQTIDRRCGAAARDTFSVDGGGSIRQQSIRMRGNHGGLVAEVQLVG